MKTLFTAATLAAAFALAGCNSTHSHDAAPGATGGDCCGSCGGGEAAPGATSGGCASKCASSCDTAECPAEMCEEMTVSPGATGGACESSCATSCDKMDAAPGATSGASCPFSGGCSDKG